MTVTQTPSTRGRVVRGRSAATAVAAVAAALLALSLFLTVAVIDVPGHVSDADLLAWWQVSSNRTAGVVSGMCALIVAVTIAVVANHLQRLDAVGRAPAWLAFGRSMAGAVTALWLVTGAVRGLVGPLVDTQGEPLPRVDVLRYTTGLNYALLGQSGMAALALFILAISVVVLRTAALGRWIAYIGLACAAVMLAAVVAQYGAFATPLAILWSLCLAVALWRAPAAEATKS
jgi:hypothetical protein